MVEGSCHCGTITFTVTGIPEWLTDCNCSICRRIGALWAHFPLDAVTVDAPKDETIAYLQGDKTLVTHSCKNCGCTTHWLPVDPAEFNRMAVNFRMCDPAVTSGISIRRFDGADTWQFID